MGDKKIENNDTKQPSAFRRYGRMVLEIIGFLETADEEAMRTTGTVPAYVESLPIEYQELDAYGNDKNKNADKKQNTNTATYYLYRVDIYHESLTQPNKNVGGLPRLKDETVPTLQISAAFMSSGANKKLSSFMNRRLGSKEFPIELPKIAKAEGYQAAAKSGIRTAIFNAVVSMLSALGNAIVSLVAFFKEGQQLANHGIGGNPNQIMLFATQNKNNAYDRMIATDLGKAYFLNKETKFKGPLYRQGQTGEPITAARVVGNEGGFIGATVYLISKHPPTKVETGEDGKQKIVQINAEDLRGKAYACFSEADARRFLCDRQEVLDFCEREAEIIRLTMDDVKDVKENIHREKLNYETVYTNQHSDLLKEIHNQASYIQETITLKIEPRLQTLNATLNKLAPYFYYDLDRLNNIKNIKEALPLGIELDVMKKYSDTILHYRNQEKSTLAENSMFHHEKAVPQNSDVAAEKNQESIKKKRRH